MQYIDEGILISVRPFGENKAIANAFTLHHGRVNGMVRVNKASRPLLQIGNTLRLEWRARLADQLGQFTLEPIHLRTYELMQNRTRLAVLGAVAELLTWFAEHDPHQKVYAAAAHALDSGTDLPLPMQAYAYLNFERLMLEELGMGLDLSECAATGTQEHLTYISPKTGRAVCADAGAPYAEKLFIFPKCFGTLTIANPPQLDDVLAGLEITGHFLARFHFEYMPNAHFEARMACVNGFEISTE